MRNGELHRAPPAVLPDQLGKTRAERSLDFAAYDLSVDYRREPEPPLNAEDAAWADELLRHKGLR